MVKKLESILSKVIFNSSDIDEIAVESRKNNDFTKKDYNKVKDYISLYGDNGYYNLVGNIPISESSDRVDYIINMVYKSVIPNMTKVELRKRLLEGDWRLTGYIIMGDIKHYD